jgi:large subunit ribosomal protein L17
VLKYQTIQTTLKRAKAVQPLVEKLLSLAKADTLDARRRAFAVLGDHKLVSHLFKELGPRFSGRTGGYTRIVNLGRRRGDNAECVIFELTEIKKKEKAKKQHLKEGKPQAQAKEVPGEALKTEAKPQPETKHKHPEEKRPGKKFFGGFKNIFKKERDSL